MLMDEGIDTGDVLLAESIAIDSRDTAGTLERKLAALGGPLVVKTLKGLLDGTVRPVPQDERFASYARKITKEEGVVDWSKSAEEIARHVRAMSPWPSAYATFAGKRLIVLEAQVAPGVRAEPGVVVSAFPLVVAAGEYGIELLRVKIEGKNEMDARAFISGYRVKPGDRFL